MYSQCIKIILSIVGILCFFQYVQLFLEINAPFKSRATFVQHDVIKLNFDSYSSLVIDSQILTESKNGSRVNIKMKSGIYLLPEKISQKISSRILERMKIDSVVDKCQFAALRMKQEQTSKQWDTKRFVVYQCRKHCGGLGDRMKGIFSVLLHTIAIGYEFIIDWDPHFSLNPDILDSSRWKNWNSNQPHLEKHHSPHFILSMDNEYKPHNLCQWLVHPVIQIQTNSKSIPQGLKNCDFEAPYIRGILNNQSSVMFCSTDITEKSHVHEHCMGCSWWFLFQIGKMLESRLIVELNRLASWKKKHRLDESFGIGVHIRSGDSHMSSSSGRESNITQLVMKIQYCIDDYIEKYPDKYHVVIVSDSNIAKGLFKKWQSLPIYCIQTNPIHIDKSLLTSASEKSKALLSALIDLFVISLQDFLLLSSSSGFGHLAHGVGLYSRKNTLFCM